jgi:hypothetical protein
MVQQVDDAVKDFETKMPGNPQLAAQKLIALSRIDVPPLRLALGDDAFPWITGALKQRLAEYEAVAELGLGTSS